MPHVPLCLSGGRRAIARAYRLLLLLTATLVATSCSALPASPPASPSGLPPVTMKNGQIMAGNKPFEVRGINYLRPTTDDPVRCPRIQFGADGNCPWDLAAIQADLDRLQDLGINTIRLFLNFYAFGGGSLTAPGYDIDPVLEHLDTFINEANQRGIYVMPVLLAKYPQDRFTPENYATALELHVRPVVQHLAGRPGILAWDLFNEPDIGSPVDIRCWDWDNGDFPLCLDLANERKRFIQAIHVEVKRIDPERLTTVGLAFAKNYFEPAEADLHLAAVVDFYSFHYYDNDPYDSGRYAAHWYYGQGFPEDLRDAIGELMLLQPDRPVVVTELGFPTGAGAVRTQGEFERDLHRALQTVRAGQASGIILWPFQDQPEEVVHNLFQEHARAR